MHRTTVFLPEELDRQLADAARRQRRPRAALLRDALERYLSTDQPRPTSIGLGHSGGAVTSETVKDVIRAEWSAGPR